MATADGFLGKWKIDQVDELLGPTGLSVDPKSRFEIGVDGATDYYFQEKKENGNVEWNGEDTDPQPKIPLTTLNPASDPLNAQFKTEVTLNVNNEEVLVYIKEDENGMMNGPIKGIELIIVPKDEGGQVGRSAKGGGDG